MEQNNKQNQRFTKKKSKYNGEMTVDKMIYNSNRTSHTLGVTLVGVISIIFGIFYAVFSDALFYPVVAAICIVGGFIIICIATSISEQEKISAILSFLAYRKQEEVDAAIYEERIEQKKQDAANALDDLMKENGDGKL